MKNTFDLFNYNYSALISIFAALMGMAYPLILQAIQRVDDMYNSTTLSKYIHLQLSFKLFNITLIISIIISLIAPFLIACYLENVVFALYVEAFHSIIIAMLIFSTVYFFKFILVTTHPTDFLLYIKEHHSDKSPALIEAFQIAKYASAHESLNLFMSAMDFLENKISKYFQQNDNMIKEESIFYSKHLEVLNDLRRLLAKDNSGYFEIYEKLVDFYYNNNKFSQINQHSYIQIWKTLDLISEKQKYAYFKQYWRSAESYYFNYINYKDSQLKPIYIEDDGQPILKFQEFHFMLGVMLIYRGQYDLLSQIFMPRELENNQTYLVPTNLSNILTLIHRLLKQKRNLIFSYDMIGMEKYRYTEELLTNAIFKYAALLITRLWTVHNYIHPNSDYLDIPNVEDIDNADFPVWLDTIYRIKQYVDIWFSNDKELKKIIRKIIDKNDVIQKLNEIRDEIMSEMQKKDATLRSSVEHIESLKRALIEELKEKDSLLPMSEQRDYLNNEDDVDILNGFFGVTIDNKKMKNSQSANPSNMASYVINRLSSQLWSMYRKKFVLEPPRVKYHIYLKEFYSSLDKLGVNKDYAILLSYLTPEYFKEHYSENNIQLQEKNGRLFYNSSPIYAFPFDNKYRALIVPRNVLPYVEIFDVDYDMSNLTKISPELKLYSNADELKTGVHPDSCLEVARGYKVHSSKDFLRYTQLEFIMNQNLPSQFDTIKTIDINNPITTGAMHSHSACSV